MSALIPAKLLPDWLMPEGRTPAAQTAAAPRPRRFLAMPADEVAFLRSTLSLYLGTPRVEEILRLFGRRIGRSMAVLDPDAPDVGATVCHLGAQVGLGKLRESSPREREELPEGEEHRNWVLTLERLAEPLPSGREKGAPVFTAGFLEGAFEGILGVRVQGELRPLEEGRWELCVDMLPSRGPEVRGTARFQLPGNRAYRMEVAEGSDFFAKLAPHVAPGATLGFTRESPRRLRAEYGFAGVEMHWFAVTYRPGESIISPRQVGHVVEIVEGFLAQRPAPVLVFLQGLDYLANRNEPHTVVRLVEIVRERVTSAGSSLVVEVPLESMDPEIVAQLRRELPDPFPAEAD
ncbi:MAG: DUF835 domain-containing protein [Euryarchaeota archaeon]|nr:DUF835 domain-containing protein [Euryarchaeota archaeon]